MIVSLVAACDRNRVIGREGRLPWDLPDDLRHFRTLTTGKPVIMGRKTFESIGRPLPNRRNIVLTRRPEPLPAGVERATSLEEALGLCAGSDEVFVIGGGEIYSLALPRADRLYLTRVDAVVEGDAKFPDWEAGGVFSEVSRESHPADERHRFAFEMVRLDRVPQRA